MGRPVVVAVEGPARVVGVVDGPARVVEVPHAVGPRGAQGFPGVDGDPGADGADGREVTLRVQGDWVQWQYVGEPGWVNLVSLLALVGPEGPEGPAGAGVELRVEAGTVQWRPVGGSWVVLVEVSELRGPQGDPGPAGADGAAGAAGADGASAYDLAVAGGFNGNLEEWLASLTGPAGEPGAGVPAGGTAGQVLAKQSWADGDTGWVDPAGVDATGVGAGLVPTSDGEDGWSWEPGGVPARQETVLTAQTALAPVARILALEATGACRVRIYRDEAQAAADADRPAGVPLGQDVVLAEHVFEAAGVMWTNPVYDLVRDSDVFEVVVSGSVTVTALWQEVGG